ARLRGAPRRPGLRDRGAVTPGFGTTDAAPSRYGASFDEVGRLLSSWGEPAYRARQVWDGLYPRRAPLEGLTDLSKGLRARLAEALPLALSPSLATEGDGGATTKWLWTAGA